ncbi:MAG: hypothetical protein AAF828_08850 [Bacteroidota bacterium]
MKRFLIVCTLLLASGLIYLSAQEELPANPPPAGATAQSPTQSTPELDGLPANRPAFNESVSPTHSDVEVWLSIGVLVFGAVITLSLLYLLAQRTKDGPANDFMDALRYPVVLVIIVASLFLVTAGYDTAQMAPILGLLGTIAGYLMGRAKPGT